MAKKDNMVLTSVKLPGELFEEFKVEESLVDGGTQLFFGCFKEDYIGIDGNTFKLFCEDDDFHLRCTVAGFERKVSSACVYHFVSKTSRTTEDYQQIESLSNAAFVKKWGFRNSQYNKVYKTCYILTGNNPGLSSFLNTFSTSTLEEANIIVEVNSNLFNQQDQNNPQGQQNNQTNQPGQQSFKPTVCPNLLSLFAPNTL